MMKKIITLLFEFMFFIMPIKTYADSATVEVKVNGEVTKGSTIEILVDVKDVENLYAASVDFTYYMNQLKVESIKAGEFIANYSNDIMELGGETDKNGNTASYSFTFLGQKEGIKGSCTLAIITAQVVNDDNLSITQDNMKVKLVKKVRNSVEDYSFKFNGYNISEETKPSNNNGNSQGNLNNNENNSVNKNNSNSNSNSNSNIESSKNTSDEDNQESSKSTNLINENKEEDLNAPEGIEEVVKESINEEKTQDNLALKDNKESNNKVNISIIVISIIVIVGSVLFYRKIYLKNKL
ncbi:cohesin domain-containing protein [Clostridium sp.]|uniref:cohesin domain-containing protein n=1 Tax=Clostridium sp. TaxID=1506 RepID=UPI0039905621